MTATVEVAGGIVDSIKVGGACYPYDYSCWISNVMQMYMCVYYIYIHTCFYICGTPTFKRCERFSKPTLAAAVSTSGKHKILDPGSHNHSLLHGNLHSAGLQASLRAVLIPPSATCNSSGPSTNRVEVHRSGNFAAVPAIPKLEDPYPTASEAHKESEHLQTRSQGLQVCVQSLPGESIVWDTKRRCLVVLPFRPTSELLRIGDPPSGSRRVLVHRARILRNPHMDPPNRRLLPSQEPTS